MAKTDAPRLRADELWVDTAAARVIDADARRKDTELQKKLIAAALTGGPYARITGRDRDGRRYRPMQKGTIERFAAVWGVEPAALLAGAIGLVIPEDGSHGGTAVDPEVSWTEADCTPRDETSIDVVTNREKEGDEIDWRDRLRRLWAKTRRRRVIALALLPLAVGLVIVADWLAFDYPARTITAYYDALNRHADTPSHHDTIAAWQLLDLGFQKRTDKWNGDWAKFDSGFETTQLHYLPINIDLTGNRWNPVRLVLTLVSGNVEFDVTFKAKDYFHRSDCFERSDEKIRPDCKSFSKELLDKLKAGTIYDPFSQHNPVITVIQEFHKDFTLKRKSIWSWSWLILDITSVDKPTPSYQAEGPQ